MRHPHVPLAIALCAILSLMTEHAHGQHLESTTTTISFAGVVDCRAITLLVQRVQTQTTRTTVDFTVNECEPGETIPRRAVATFRSDIPNADFTNDHAGAKLLTTSPHGPMTVTWALTDDGKSTFDATWHWFTPTNQKQTQHDDVRSVVATGSIGSFLVGQRVGQLVISALSRRE